VLYRCLNVADPAPPSAQVLKYASAAAQWVAGTDQQGGGGAASVTSAEYLSLVNQVSANSADLASLKAVVSNALSAGDVASNAISIVSAAHLSLVSVVSALSQRVSVEIPWNAAVYRIMSTGQSTAGSALVDMSGLVLTVNAGETWEIDGMVMFSTSATTVGLKLGTSVPPLSTPRIFTMTRMLGTQTSTLLAGAGVLQVSGNSVNTSIAALGPAAGVSPVLIKAIFNVASAGTFRLMFAGIASTAQSPIQAMEGSYFKAFRIK
jgi:hypothetical protein